MSDEILQRLGVIQKDLAERDEATKREFGAIREELGKTLTEEEYEKRRAEAKEELATKDDVKLMVKEAVEAASSLGNRTTELVPDRGDRTYFREVGELAQTPDEAKKLYEDFLCSRPQDDQTDEMHKLSTRLTILQRYGSWYANRNDFPRYSIAESKNLDVRRMFSRLTRYQLETFGEDFMKRAFDTTAGATWVPSVLGSDLMRYVEVRGNLIPNLRTFPLPAATWSHPYTTGTGKAYRIVEQTSSPAGTDIDWSKGAPYTNDDPPDGARQFSVKRLRGKIISSREFIEESIIPILDFAIQDVADQIRRAIEDAMINGDTDSPGLDSDLSYSATNNMMDSRTMWDGFRDYAAENDAASNTEQAATSNHATVGNAISIRTAMGRYGINPNNLFWVCGLKSYLDLLDLPEMLTMDKVGTQATALTGQLGTFLGIPIIVSEYVREDLAASGVNTTTTDSQTEMLLVYRPVWMLGNWRGITTEPERIAPLNMDVVWSWWGGDFKKVCADAEPTEAAIIDID